MTKKSVLTFALPVAFLVGVALVGFGLYLWTESQESFFASRYLRLLGRISDQVEQAIEGRRRVIFSAVRHAETLDIETLQHQRDFVVPEDLEKLLRIAAFKPPPDNPPEPRTSLALHDRGTRQWLVATFSGQVKENNQWGGVLENLEIETDLTPLVDRIAQRSLVSPFEHGSRFDYLVVTESNGKRILFSPAGAGGRIRSYDEIRSPSGEVWPLELRAKASDVVLGGQPYKLFVRPLALHLETLSRQGTGLDRNWLIAGLVSSERFRSDSLSIHYGLLAAAVFLCLMLLLAYPMMELQFLGSRDSYSRLRLARLLLSVILGTSLTTLIVIDLFGYISAQSITDGQLKDLGTRIQGNFSAEKKKLDALAEQLADETVVAEIHSKKGERIKDILQTKPWEQIPALEGQKVLDDDSAGSLNTIAWMKESGEQSAKWSVRKHSTPFVSVSSRSYFQKAKRGTEWSDGPRSASAIELIRSMTTGETTVALSRSISGSKEAVAVAVIARMGSIIEPVLPEGYRFALLDHAGTVLLHSDPGRGHRESFLEEAENNRQLLAALQGREPRNLDISYEGSFYRIRLMPMENTPWILVLMREKRPLQSSNIQVLWVTAILVSLASLLLFGLFYLLQSLLKVQLKWMLQTETLGHCYSRLAIGYGVVLSGYATALLRWPDGKLFVLGLLTGALSILVAYRCLELEIMKRRRRWRWISYAYIGRLDGLILVLIAVLCVLGSIGNYGATDWLVSLVVVGAHGGGLLWAALLIYPPTERRKPRLSHLAWAGCLFLTLLAVVPTLATYRIVAHSEVRRFVINVQSRMVEALEERARRVETATSKIALAGERGEFLEARLALVGAQDVYTDVFLGTCLVLGSDKKCDTDKPRPDQKSDSSSWLTAKTRALFSRLTLVFDAPSLRFDSFRPPPILGTSATNGEEPVSWAVDGGAALVFEKQHYVGSAADPRPALRVRSKLPRLRGDLLLVALVLCSLPLYLLLVFLSRRLFVSDIATIESDVVIEPETVAIDRHTLILAGEGEWRAELKKSEEIEYINLAGVAWSRADGDWTQARNWNDRGTKKALFLDHLDFRADEPEVNTRKLDLLELLFGSDGRTVIVASTVAPETFTLQSPGNAESDGSQDLQARWNLLFRRCRRVYFDTERRSTERETSHYDRLWRKSSMSERATLLRLSETGLVNAKRLWAAKRLADRGLVEAAPLRLRDTLQGFGEFIRSRQHRREVEAWESEGSTGKKWRLWRWVPLILGLALAAFLFTTQEELRSSVAQFNNIGKMMASALAAVSLAIPSLRKLLSSFGNE